MSIKVKIFAYLLAFCTLLLGLLWAFQVVFLDEIYKSVKMKEIKSAMNTLSTSLNHDELVQIADDIVENQDIFVEIFRTDGVVLYFPSQNIEERQKIPVNEKARLYTMTIENGGEYLEYLGTASPYGNQQPGTRRDMQPSPQTIRYSKIIEDDTGEEVLIILNAMISPVNATVNTLRMELYFITGFMILFSVFLAALISRRVSKPIVSLNESAKVLASGKYDVDFKAEGYREINELSDTLNYTARELSKVEALRRELIANVSHDLRTPLTLIAGYAEAMRDLPGENNGENAQVIVDETKRLSTLVSDMLDISKLQSGAQDLSVSSFNLTGTMRKAVDGLASMMKSKGYVIEFQGDGEVEVAADEARIMQAFHNLMINAINFTGEDKKVIVRQTIYDGDVLIEVIDTGCGISEEDLPYIWDRYYKTGESHKRAVVGTGIGLSIVKSVMELHGAPYGVSSEENHGSTFWFRLKK